jgi:hypothetical protein
MGDGNGAGDPGIFDFLKRGVGKLFGGAAAAGTAVVPFVGPAVRVAIPVAGGLIRGIRRGAAIKREQMVGRTVGLGPFRKTIGAPAAAGAAPARGFPGGKRRRMNVANVKALRRAVRRLAGFTNLSRAVFATLRGIAPAKKRRAPKGLLPSQRRRRLGRGDSGDFYMGDGDG